MTTTEMPMVIKMMACSRLRKLLLCRFSSLGFVSKTIAKNGMVRPRKKTAKGAVFSEKAFVGVLMTNALFSFCMVA